MNQSHFIRTLKEKHKVDFQEIWKSTIGYKSEYDQKRAFNDSVETEFWKNYSLKYDSVPSLIDYGPEVLDALINITGRGKTLIEFGCGTGKFTLPMARVSRSIVGVDFSKDMLKQLEAKLVNEDVQNVELLNGKLESAELPMVDVVYGINANYRMLNIEEAIGKMRALANERVVIVWTMQRSPYDAILNKTKLKGIGRGQEYIQLLNVLYNMGIDPSMHMMTIIKPMPFDNIKEHYEAIEKICSEYDLETKEVLDAFNSKVTQIEGQYVYQCPLKVAIIHFES